MTKLQGLLVGMHFHPPAKLLLSALPAGARLRLEPEPDNPWDAGAIKVLASPSAVPQSMESYLAQALPETGHDWQELREMEWVMLGHLAATGGKPLLKAPHCQGNSLFLPFVEKGEREAELAFDGQGQPLVIFSPTSQDGGSHDRVG